MLSTRNIIIFVIATLVSGTVFYYIAPFIIPQATQPLSTYILMFGMVMGFIATFLISQLNARDNEIISLFVGNLPFKASSRQIQSIFEKYGNVQNVRIMTDKVTRKPRGYGFIEMGRSDGTAAINALNGYEFMGRELKVNIATNKKQN